MSHSEDGVESLTNAGIFMNHFLHLSDVRTKATEILVDLCYGRRVIFEMKRS